MNIPVNTYIRVDIQTNQLICIYIYIDIDICIYLREEREGDIYKIKVFYRKETSKASIKITVRHATKPNRLIPWWRVNMSWF